MGRCECSVPCCPVHICFIYLSSAAALSVCWLNRCAAEKQDLITVRDGSVRNAAVLAKYCSSYHQHTATTTLPVIISTGLSSLVEFTTDHADERQGFSATFEFIAAADGPLQQSRALTDQLPSLSVSVPSVSSVGQLSPGVKPSQSGLGNSSSLIVWTDVIATERHLSYRITPDTGRPVLELPTPQGLKAELTLVVGYNTEMVYLFTDKSPIQVLTTW